MGMHVVAENCRLKTSWGIPAITVESKIVTSTVLGWWTPTGKSVSLSDFQEHVISGHVRVRDLLGNYVKIELIYSKEIEYLHTKNIHIIKTHNLKHILFHEIAHLKQFKLGDNPMKLVSCETGVVSLEAKQFLKQNNSWNWKKTKSRKVTPEEIN